MATASIVIEQPTNVIPVGTPGRSRDDLSLAPITLRNSDDTDVNTWRWALLDKPGGSIVTLPSPTSPSVTFTPDVAGGTWRVQLSVNLGGTGEVDRILAIVRDDFGHRRPAAGELGAESDYLIGGSPNARGWAVDTNDMFSAIDQVDLITASGPDFMAPVAASTVVAARGGLGLPAIIGDVTATDFVDLRVVFGAPPNAGVAPVINGIAFTTTLVSTYSVVLMTYDLDTSGSAIGDRWQIVTTRADPAKRFLFASVEIV